MLKANPILLSVTVLVLVSLACVIPSLSVAPTPIPGAMETQVAQMIVVALTQTAQSLPPSPIPTDTPPFTFTPELPTFTPTAYQSPTFLNLIARQLRQFGIDLPFAAGSG